MKLLLARHPRLQTDPGADDAAGQALAPLDAALLTWLALEGPTPRAQLATWLWPDSDAEAARNGLRQRLFRLRRDHALDLAAGPSLLAWPAGCAHDLDGAPGVLQGLTDDALPGGAFGTWLATQRAQRLADWRQAQVAQADAAERAGDWPRLLARAQALLAEEPLSEDAHRRLIRAHYLRGDRAAALLAFDHCEQVLKDEVGAQPSAATLALLRTVEAAAPVAVLPTGVPAAVLRPPRLIGRDAEWARLAEAWGQGQPVLVLGEAGLGKSRLLGDFAQQHAGVLCSGGRPGDDRVPCTTLSRLLRALPAAAVAAWPVGVRRELAQLLPELGEPADGAGDWARARFTNAVAHVLHPREGGPVAVWLDDLHFADDTSLELLAAVVPALAGRWWLAARPAELGPGGRALVAALSEQAPLARLVLQPLTVAEVAALLASLDLPGGVAGDWAPALTRLTGGNPLFLLEALKAGWPFGPGGPDQAPQGDPVAGGGAGTGRALTATPGKVGLAPQRWPVAQRVSALIEGRIARLSPAAVQLARCAAVATPDFDIGLAAHVLGQRTLDLADPWAELEAAQVFRDGGAFAHDLIYEAARASVPGTVARQLHREVAAYLAAHQGAPARVAAHWQAGGDLVQALAAWQRAAQAADDGRRKREAFQAWLQCAELASQLGDGEARFDALAAALAAAEIADRTLVDDALLARLEAAAGTPGQRLRWCLARAQLAENRGEFPLGMAMAESALALARELDDGPATLRATRTAAACATFSGQAARAVQLLRPALPWVLAHGSPEDQQTFFNDLGACLDDVDQPDEAQQYHRRGLALALQMGRLDQAAIACNNLTYSLKPTGRFQAALEMTRQARRHLAGFDDARATSYATDLMAFSLLRDLARYEEALRAGEWALETAGQNPAAQPTALRHMVCLWLHLGQMAKAQAALAASRQFPLPPHIRCRDAQLEGRLERALGRDGRAAFETALATAPDMGRTLATAMITVDHAQLLPPAAALAACAQVVARCDPIGYHGVVLAARIRGARLAAAAPELASQAADLARQALATPADIEPDDLYRGELWWAAGLALQAAGAEGEARAAVRQGLDWVSTVAETQVPPSFRDAFVHRQPVNAALRTLAARLGA